MVCELGMSDNLGPLTFGKKEEMVFLGREIASHKDYSEQTAVLIDQEVRKIAEDGYHEATRLLNANLDKLHLLAGTLLERETIDGGEMDRLLKGEKLDPIARQDDGSAAAPVTPAAVAESPGPALGGAFGTPPPAPRPAGA
jgi:cell division protease FtsH